MHEREMHFSTGQLVLKRYKNLGSPDWPNEFTIKKKLPEFDLGVFQPQPAFRIPASGIDYATIFKVRGSHGPASVNKAFKF